MLSATISADVVASSSLSADEMKHLTGKVYCDIFESLKEYQKGEKFIARLVLGDMIECFIENPGDALRVALVLKSGIKSFKLENPSPHNHSKRGRARKLFETFGVRIAIGIGEMDMNLFENDIFNGSAINISGRLISDEKTSGKERVTVKNTLFIGSINSDHTYVFQPVLSLLDALFNRMTPRQSEIVYLKLLGHPEHRIAEMYGVTQSSVNQHSTSAGWNSVEEAINLFSTFDFNVTFAPRLAATMK